MAKDLKPPVDYDSTLGKLDIRLGRVVEILEETTAPKKSFRLTVDFGKFGERISVGRFTQHHASELQGKQVVGVLNFEPRKIGEVTSEVLILGVQYPKADSGEATYLTPAIEAKLGSKMF